MIKSRKLMCDKNRKEKANIGCFLRCGKPLTNKDSFVVHDTVWSESGLPSELPNVFVNVHKECFEKRIGRKLVREDFRPCEINKKNGWRK